MVTRIVGYGDARYALNHLLSVKLGPKLSDAYGRKHDTINLSLSLLASSPFSKFAIDINIPGAILRLNAENLILYHNEIVDSLKQLKYLVTSHRQRQQEIAEYEKHLAELQQIELEKLYNQYGGHACKSL